MKHDDLPTRLARALAIAPEGPLHVAFSGGPDSTALLHALSLLPEARARGLRALHVDHRLHADSARWSAHCLAQCARWQIPVELLCVSVPCDTGTGTEAAARDARYAALARRLPHGGLLALAQHREDQAETVLLKLLRGAGPDGLAGMAPLRPFASGWLWRPLLQTPRDCLLQHVERHALSCIDDPANRDARHARSFLRQEVMPLLQRHWRNAPAAIAHAARLQRAVADDLAQRADAALQPLLDATTQTLDADGWLAVAGLLRGPVLERWLHTQGLHAPTTTQRAALEAMLTATPHDRSPELRSGNTVLRAWRGRLYAEPWTPLPPETWQFDWHGEPLPLPGGAQLRLVPQDQASAVTLRVRAIHRGERLQAHGNRHARDLGSLFQRTGVPPWQRLRCPVIETPEGVVLALGDLLLTDAGDAFFSQLDKRPAWRRGPLSPSCEQAGHLRTQPHPGN